MVLRKRGKPGAAGYIVSAIEKQSDNFVLALVHVSPYSVQDSSQGNDTIQS